MQVDCFLRFFPACFEKKSRCNAYKEIKRAKIECLFAIFLFFKLSLEFGLDFDFKLKSTLGWN